MRIQISAVDRVAREQMLSRIARSAPGFAVQLRDPTLDARQLHEWGRVLRAATRAVGARLFVNDRIDIAMAIEADGAHLGRRSVTVRDARLLMGDAFISCSAHDESEACRAAEAGADAVLLSPVFASPGKGPPLGLELLGAVRAVLPARVALIALGGITRKTAPACFAAGADGVAAMMADLSLLPDRRHVRGTMPQQSAPTRQRKGRTVS